MNTMHKVINTCEETTKLILQQHEGKLSIVTKFRIKLHLMVCDACRRFNIQNKWIDEQIEKFHQEFEQESLSESCKEKMSTLLQNEIDNN